MQEFSPELYVDTFENKIARGLRQIGHSPETGKKRFYNANVYDTAIEIGKHLPRDAPGLLLDMFICDPRLNKGKEMTGIHRCSFSILRHVARRSEANDLAAKNEMFFLMMKVIGKLNEMYEDNPVTYNFDFDDVRMESEGPLFDNFFGWRYEFGWHQKLDRLTAVKPEDWT